MGFICTHCPTSVRFGSADGLLIQVLHVAEEYSTRFYVRFPSELGLAPWSSDFFLIFNLCWLGIWVWAAFGLRAGHTLALFPVWFFAIAAMVNGVAHPLLAARAGGYFPGLLTSPLLGVIGVWLCVRLAAITESRPGRTTWRSVLLFLEALVFSVIVPGAVVYWIPRDALDLWGETSPHPWSVWQAMAVVPLALGLAVYLWCLWEFARRGRGIPAPVDHPKRLVVTGLYRYVRNPMYVGVLLFLLGQSLFFESSSFLLYAIAWLAFVHVNVILYEEPNLHRKFGDSYDRYRSAVRRWIPGKGYLDAG
jgi:protein-S-isoprenylcysteine O-methyltransferase Ste14